MRLTDLLGAIGGVEVTLPGGRTVMVRPLSFAEEAMLRAAWTGRASAGGGGGADADRVEHDLTLLSVAVGLGYETKGVGAFPVSHFAEERAGTPLSAVDAAKAQRRAWCAEALAELGPALPAELVYSIAIKVRKVSVAGMLDAAAKNSGGPSEPPAG